jgi:Na+:H+ antiporter, NhaA family
VAEDAGTEHGLPRQPIDRIVGPVMRFLHVEATSGVLLLVCTLIALVAANSPMSQWYLGFWETKIGFTFGDFAFQYSLKHMINDGLMAIFFFVIGLEVKREMVFGELGDLRRAALPIAAAVGGMVVPAGVYFAIQYGQPASRGWGIPMATDIAFVVGCMAILGSRVPHNLRILLLSLAIVDDIGAILVIAIGYTDDLSWGWLGVAALGIGVVYLLSRVGVRRVPVYVAAGIVVWFAFYESGVHATIAGVILGLMTPARAMLNDGVFSGFLRRASQMFEGGGWESQPHRAEKVRRFQHLTRETISPLENLENTLHPWTSFVIMPIFALANAGVPLQVADLNDSIAVAVILGLVVGKPVGIFAFSWLAVKFGWARLPKDITWIVLIAAGFLAGIGFTMALFIAGLALQGDLLNTAKVGVLVGSAVSAVVGIGLMIRTLPKKAE